MAPKPTKSSKPAKSAKSSKPTKSFKTAKSSTSFSGATRKPAKSKSFSGKAFSGSAFSSQSAGFSHKDPSKKFGQNKSAEDRSESGFRQAPKPARSAEPKFPRPGRGASSESSFRRTAKTERTSDSAYASDRAKPSRAPSSESSARQTVKSARSSESAFSTDRPRLSREPNRASNRVSSSESSFRRTPKTTRASESAFAKPRRASSTESSFRSTVRPALSTKQTEPAQRVTSQRLADPRELDKKDRKPKPTFFVWGRHPVESALTKLAASNEEISYGDYGLHIIVDKQGKAPAQLKPHVDLAKSLGISIKLHASQEEEWPISSDDSLNHQRVCLKVPSLETTSLDELMESLEAASLPNGCVGVVCDQIMDPGNFGAIIRTAAFFGARFVLFATDRQAGLSPHVVRTSAGGIFDLQIVETVNITRALEKFKTRNMWTVSTTLSDDAIPLSQLPVDRPYVVIFGNEEKGVRNQVNNHCDYKVKIPGGSTAVDSLNVSVAAGVVISHLSR